MIAATSILKPPPTRVARVGSFFTLPRPVRLISAVAFLVGAVVGLAVSAPIAGGLRGMLMGMSFGAAGGVFVVTYQPMRGESLAMWMWVNVQAFRSRGAQYHGEPVRMYVGLCPVSHAARGKMRIRSGAVNVRPDGFDHRGVPTRGPSFALFGPTPPAPPSGTPARYHTGAAPGGGFAAPAPPPAASPVAPALDVDVVMSRLRPNETSPVAPTLSGPPSPASDAAGPEDDDPVSARLRRIRPPAP